MTDNLSLDGTHYTESATAKAAEGMRVPVMEVIIDDLKRENERLRSALEELAAVPDFLPLGKNENGDCIMCGINYQKLENHIRGILNPNKESGND